MALDELTRELGSALLRPLKVLCQVVSQDETHCPSSSH
jgi:hypothetical protein